MVGGGEPSELSKSSPQFKRYGVPVAYVPTVATVATVATGGASNPEVATVGVGEDMSDGPRFRNFGWRCDMCASHDELSGDHYCSHVANRPRGDKRAGRPRLIGWTSITPRWCPWLRRILHGET